MSSDPKPAAADAKKLVPILILVAVLSCGCIAVPIVGGVALLSFMSARYSHAVNEAMDEAQAVDVQLPHIMDEVRPPPTDFGGIGGLGGGSNAKEAAHQQLLAAEQRFNRRQCPVRSCSGPFTSSSGTSTRRPAGWGLKGSASRRRMPPDPSLAFEAAAAQQAYEAAKAEYESLP
jgi:hypothetical protein